MSYSSLKKIAPFIKFFDVSMRDGLQSIPDLYTLKQKKIMLNKIINTYYPESLEIGSLVSHKILPQMKDSYELYKYATKYYIHKNNVYIPKFYLLVPPTEHYLEMAKNLNIKNISIMSSVSNKFQEKNVRLTLHETKNNIIKALNTYKTLENKNQFDNVKVYLSCITQCPISGKIDNDLIVNELYNYLQIDTINEVCISDTCGKMNYNDFIHIIDYLSIDMKSNLSKVSLHLHCNDKLNYDTINNIINYAIKHKIYKFDVSTINAGGCTITLNNNDLHNNLTYTRLFRALY
jgi:isopropylmalate/homocitrate/citramalate synthase